MKCSPSGGVRLKEIDYFYGSYLFLEGRVLISKCTQFWGGGTKNVLTFYGA